MRRERRKRKAVEDKVTCEVEAVGVADRRCYLHVNCVKETLPQDQDMLTLLGGCGKWELRAAAAPCYLGSRWDAMVSAGDVHGGTLGPLEGNYVHLIIFQQSWNMSSQSWCHEFCGIFLTASEWCWKNSDIWVVRSEWRVLGRTSVAPQQWFNIS